MDVKALCDRCLWLENGRPQRIGDTDEVVANYLERALHGTVTTARAMADAASEPTRRRFGNQAAEVISWDLLDAAREPSRILAPGAAMAVRVMARANSHVESPIFGFLVRSAKGETIFGSNTARENYPVHALAPGEEFTAEFHWIAPRLAEGRYFISVGIAEGNMDDFEMRDYIEDAIAADAPPSHPPVHGYLRLDCESVTVARS
jgi:lipopolysaccharide transport system ATP-binding protein